MTRGVPARQGRGVRCSIDILGPEWPAGCIAVVPTTTSFTLQLPHRMVFGPAGKDAVRSVTIHRNGFALDTCTRSHVLDAGKARQEREVVEEGVAVGRRKVERRQGS